MSIPKTVPWHREEMLMWRARNGQHIPLAYKLSVADRDKRRIVVFLPGAVTRRYSGPHCECYGMVYRDWMDREYRAGRLMLPLRWRYHEQYEKMTSGKSNDGGGCP